MQKSEKVARLKAMLKQIALDDDKDLEAFSSGSPDFLEGISDEGSARVARGLDKLAKGRESELSNEETEGLEAIVMVRQRPVVFVRNGSYPTVPSPWQSLNQQVTKKRIEPLLSSIGRIELPNNPRLPYGGTGFVVGPKLVMTNRHVAKLFAEGLGTRGLVFRPGDAAIDFKQEKGTLESDRSAFLVVNKVRMIHPYWDMALLEVEGLTAAQRPLILSVRAPEELVGKEVVVVGYPARDDRNDLAVQDRIFESTYYVKRLQPGKVRARASVKSFENNVSAMTHDASTLGGNSGSAIVDVERGEILGLHFAGVYLKANYAVPAFELARDPRVVQAGLNFAGKVQPSNDTAAAWQRAEGNESSMMTKTSSVDDTQSAGPAVTASGGSVTWTIPLQVTVSIGQPTLAQPAPVAPAPAPTVAPTTAAASEAPRMQVPIIYDDLPSRAGFDATFLDLDEGEEVPLPVLTVKGKSAAAKLDDSSTELRYHRFSIVMHKTRRLALFTAANVDWRDASRKVNGKKPSRRELTGIPDGTQEEWVSDPRIPESQQLPDLFFTRDDGAFDKGHVVRRDDVCWGESFEDMQKGNGDTFHTTNCTPQVAAFNRSTLGEDNWGDLEEMVQKETRAEKVCVLAGPVLDEHDSFFHGRDLHGKVSVQIPRSFWKIIVSKGQNGPEVYGFVLEQDLGDVPLHEELIVPARWKAAMKSIDEIEGLLGGLAKLDWYKRFDQSGSEEGARIQKHL